MQKQVMRVNTTLITGSMVTIWASAQALTAKSVYLTKCDVRYAGMIRHATWSKRLQAIPLHKTEVSRANLTFEFMLNALRLADGFDVQLFMERSDCATNITDILDKAAQQGFVTFDGIHVQPTAQGFNFLNDLQMMFLPSP